MNTTTRYKTYTQNHHLDQAREISRAAKLRLIAIDHPIRSKMIQLYRVDQDITADQIAAHLGIGIDTINRHITILRRSGVIKHEC